jgi:NADPH-dependent curcumin reductase CurA
MHDFLAGSEEKVNYVVTKLGFDSAFNYKTETTRTALARLALKGIDYFYDTIGGETLETVVDLINEKGHILSIGMLSQENGKEGYPIRNLNLLAPKGATIHGFIYYHHLNYFGELDETVRPLLERGEIEYKQQVFDGIENAPEHFINMLDGKYAGKVAIKIADL